jgi:hypothetical protein
MAELSYCPTRAVSGRGEYSRRTFWPSREALRARWRELCQGVLRPLGMGVKGDAVGDGSHC